MGKYVRYERFKDTLSHDEINEKLKTLIEEGLEIVYYNENSVGIINDIENFSVTIISGKLNEGTKQFL